MGCGSRPGPDPMTGCPTSRSFSLPWNLRWTKRRHLGRGDQLLVEVGDANAILGVV